jgi:RNA polymerase sigma-70 factor (ECF subfamily)
MTEGGGAVAAQSFEEHRSHLRTVAHRMLGSLTEADDAVQEAWLRMERADISGVRNVRGWLTTVVARICLDMLRSRRTRSDRPLETAPVAPESVDPEAQAVLADSVGVALLVILQNLSPAERLAFVLHDMFDLPYSEIAPILGRSENSTAQLASRARRRVRGKSPQAASDFVQQRRLVDAFLAAARDGDFDALLAVLHEDVILRVDAAAAGTPRTFHGAHIVAANARMFSANARFAEPALVDDAVGIVVAPNGRLAIVLQFKVAGNKITQIDIIADPQTLREFHLAVLNYA